MFNYLNADEPALRLPRICPEGRDLRLGGYLVAHVAPRADVSGFPQEDGVHQVVGGDGADLEQAFGAPPGPRAAARRGGVGEQDAP